MQAEAQPQLGRINGYLLRATHTELAFVYGIACILVLTVGLLVTLGISARLQLGDADAVAAIACGIILLGIVFGQIVASSTEYQHRQLDEELGMKLTTDNRISLALWFKHGVIPTEPKLQPVLSNYVTYLHNIMTGKKFNVPIWLQLALTVIYGSKLVEFTAKFVQDPAIWSYDGFMIVSNLFLILLIYPRKSGTSNWLMVAMNRRQIRKIERMRTHLEAQSAVHRQS